MKNKKEKRKEGNKTPKGDRTGPRGQGQEKGKAMRGKGQGGRGRGGGSAKGPGSYCVCPNCGEKAVHQQGSPCYEQKCPKCGTAMARE